MKIKALLKDYSINDILISLCLTIIVIIIFSELADAYTLSYAKAKFNNTEIKKPIPFNMNIDRLTINKILNCKSTYGSVMYQIGFDEGCDYVRSILGLKTKEFKTRPSLIQDTTEYFKIPINKTFIDFNNSVNRFEFFDSNHTLYKPYNIFGNKTKWINITYIRVYLK